MLVDLGQYSINETPTCHVELSLAQDTSKTLTGCIWLWRAGQIEAGLLKLTWRGPFLKPWDLEFFVTRGIHIYFGVLFLEGNDAQRRVSAR